LWRDPSPFDRKGERVVGAGGAAKKVSLGTFLYKERCKLPVRQKKEPRAADMQCVIEDMKSRMSLR